MGEKTAIKLPGIFNDVLVFDLDNFKKSDYEVELAVASNKFSRESRVEEGFRSHSRYESENLKKFSLKRLAKEAEECHFESFKNKIILGFLNPLDDEAVEYSGFKSEKRIMLLRLLLIQEKGVLSTEQAKEKNNKEKAQAALATWNTVWAKSNWGRLLLIRAMSACYAFTEFPLFIHGTVFSLMNTVFSRVSMFMAPLSYSMYLLRICTVLAPYLIQASLEGGVAGLNAALWEKSQALANDMLWFVVGVTTAIITVAGFPMVSMVLVCTLYLFDLLNAVCHDIRDKQHHKKHQADLLHQINNDIAENEFIHMNRIFPVLRRMLRKAPKDYMLVSFTMDLCNAMAQNSESKGIIELQKLGLDFTEQQAKRLLMYTQDKIKENEMLAGQCKILGGHIPFAVIEVSCLLAGVVGTTVGTGLVLAGMGSQFLTATSIIPAILAAVAALTLTSMIGLGLIAVGAAIILTICAIHLVKEVIEAIKKPKDKKRQQRSVLRAAEYSSLSKEKAALSY